MKTKLKILLTGGGTGGHFYPLLAIADFIKVKYPESKISFMGLKDKIEEKEALKNGYQFVSIPAVSIIFGMNKKNFLNPLKMLFSILKAFIYNLLQQPNVIVGSGAFISFPGVVTGKMLGIKTLILEQNELPGSANLLMEKYSDLVVVNFEESLQYFKNKDKVKVLGNPIRNSLFEISREDAIEKYSLNKNKKTLLVLGGSLGARKINQMMEMVFERLIKENIQIIWQAGSYFYNNYKKYNSYDVKVFEYIDEIKYAYAASNLIISRAGATTISEGMSLGLAFLLVPSPNAANKHQHKNAELMKKNNAAELFYEEDNIENFYKLIINIIKNDNKLEELITNLKKLNKENSTENIVNEILKLAERG